MLRYTVVASRRHNAAIALYQASADSLIRWSSSQAEDNNEEEQPQKESTWRKRVADMKESDPNRIRLMGDSPGWKPRPKPNNRDSSLEGRFKPNPFNNRDSSEGRGRPNPNNGDSPEWRAKPNPNSRDSSEWRAKPNPFNRDSSQGRFNSNPNNNRDSPDGQGRFKPNNNRDSPDVHGGRFKPDNNNTKLKDKDPLTAFFQRRKEPQAESGVASWRQRLQKHAPQQPPQQQSPSQQSSPSMTQSSWRSKLSQKSSPNISDMKDVSALRAAFLKSIVLTNEQQKNKKPEDQKSDWRKQNLPQQHGGGGMSSQPTGGAREYRKRVQQQEWKQNQQNQQQHRPHYQRREWVPADANAFKADKSVYDKEAKRKERQQQTLARRQREADDKKVMLPPTPLDVTALSSIFRVKIDVIMRKLRELGERPKNDDHIVDIDTMEVVALDLGLEPTRSSRRATQSASEEHRDLLLQRRTDDDESKMDASALLPPRPPVVCIMGHVDHGKTTLMDALRRKNIKKAVSTGKKKKNKNKKGGDNTKKESDDVAGTEAGGITQVISAFQVALEGQENGAVTFLDTPGHAAFRAMRESGSHAADVIVLVVAADDGVSNQTVEILNFYKSIVAESGGGISLLVAMTKVDKPGINVEESQYRIENELMEHGIVSESFASTSESKYGPPVQLVPVSGLTGEGLDDLIDALVLQSEVMELRADPDARAEGIVLDARIEKGVGVVADCIIRWGSMERGDVLLSGVHSGKVKALKDGKELACGLFLIKLQISLTRVFFTHSHWRNPQEGTSFPTSQNHWIQVPAKSWRPDHMCRV